MTNILALDTSTEACSCALITGKVISEQYAVVPRQHTQLLLPMVHSLMAEAGIGFPQLDAVAFGRGPGSFTGLRIAAGVAQGIAFAADIPVLPVSTLATVAAEAAGTENRLVFSCLDARIDELYWCWYQVMGGEPMAVTPEQLCKPESTSLSPLQDGTIIAAGNGLAYLSRLPVVLQQKILHSFPAILPRSAIMARLAQLDFTRGKGVSADQIEPLYLRDKVTHQH